MPSDIGLYRESLASRSPHSEIDCVTGEMLQVRVFRKKNRVEGVSQLRLERLMYLRGEKSEYKCFFFKFSCLSWRRSLLIFSNT